MPRTAGRRPRLADIAQRAGVSLATVDRVLNRRPGVRPLTASRVLKVAAALDCLPDPAILAAGLRPLRIAFVLPAGSNRYLHLLGRLVGAARERAGRLALRPRLEPVAGFRPELLARHLRAVARDADAIAFMALEDPLVTEAVNDLAARGIPCVTLISDLPGSARAAYLGLDNRAAGRAAAWLIGRFLPPGPAEVAMIAGSLAYRAHQERAEAFPALFAEAFPAITVLPPRLGHDEAAENYRQARALLALHSKLGAIYNMGGGAEGIARALREAGRERDVVLIAHGLTADTSALLEDGTADAVITQNPHATINDCLAVFDNLRAGRPALAGIEAPRTEIVLAETLP
ncbi:MAG: LacI family DNA-binding transcriptional regulator [Rhodospirillales bacterium]|nr:LacI family DNA-binding transcriptional regulator [Rhodospirillales bacterium]